MPNVSRPNISRPNVSRPMIMFLPVSSEHWIPPFVSINYKVYITHFISSY
jgi:hypothetical protein